jgi:hypothetical protein
MQSAADFGCRRRQGLSRKTNLTTTGRQGNAWFETCLATLGEAHDESVYGAIERLVEAGEQVGFTVHDLIRMLNGGMTLECLLDVIEVRMTGACLDPESKVA